MPALPRRRPARETGEPAGPMIDESLITHGIIALAILAGFAVLGQLLKKFLKVFVGGLLLTTKTSLDDRILAVIRSRIAALSIITGGFIASDEIRKGLSSEQVTYERILSYIDIALYFILVLVLVRLAGKILTAILEWYMDDVSAKT